MNKAMPPKRKNANQLHPSSSAKKQKTKAAITKNGSLNKATSKPPKFKIQIVPKNAITLSLNIQRLLTSKNFETREAKQLPNNAHLSDFAYSSFLGNVSIALANDKCIYTWGKDDNFGMLGQGSSTEVVTAPQRLPVDYKKTSFIQIGAGFRHAFALAEDGTVFFWGMNVHYHKISNPQICKNLMGKYIIQISSSTDHALFLSDTGNIYIWGELCTQHHEFSPVKMEEEDSTAVQIATGVDFCLSLTSSGKVYSWGKNAVMQLGYTTSKYQDYRTTPKRVTALDDKQVSNIYASEFVSLATTRDNKVFFWGGMSYDKTCTLPIQLSFFNNMVVDKICVTNGFPLILANGKAYLWGSPNMYKDDDEQQEKQSGTPERRKAITVSTLQDKAAILLPLKSRVVTISAAESTVFFTFVAPRDWNAESLSKVHAFKDIMFCFSSS